MGLGTNLKKILKENNMTIKELSEKSGVSINTLYSITKRDSLMSRYDIIKKISSALEISTEELTGHIIDESQTSIKNARLYEVIKREKDFEPIDIQKLSEVISQSTDFETEKKIAEIVSGLIDNESKRVELNRLYNTLNNNGQDKALEQVELLTKIPEYRKIQ